MEKPLMCKKYVGIIVFLLLVGSLLSVGFVNIPKAEAASSSTLDTSKLTGIAWFGSETGNLHPHGLWDRCYRSMIDQMWSLGFNCLRLPFSNDMIHSTKTSFGIDYNLGYNYELVGLTPLQIFDKVIDYAYSKGFVIIIDRHCTAGSIYPMLWYDGNVSDQQWIDDWKFMVQRYGNKIWGADLANEPHGDPANGGATWGDGVLETDWCLAAERCGAELLAINSQLKIVVEGIQEYQGYWDWWGGNLMGVRNHPVNLNNVIYSPHDYGPNLYRQDWFYDPDFPNNMENIWDTFWGFIEKEGLGEVWVGEFGTNQTLPPSNGSPGALKQAQWFHTLIDYMETNGIEFAYWAMNGNEGNGYGILEKDWKTVDETLWNALKPYLGGDTSNPILYADP